MPCIVDVRDEKQVQKAIDEAVKKVSELKYKPKNTLLLLSTYPFLVIAPILICFVMFISCLSYRLAKFVLILKNLNIKVDKLASQ